MTSRTPSGILNELAKNNEIIPNYSPSEESGPAHQRTFKVKLLLAGLGEYEGVGASIKDAKNAAADCALLHTFSGGESTNQVMKISPTVELNVLSMRAGEEITYEEHNPLHIANTMPVAQFETHVMPPKRNQLGNRVLYRRFLKIWNIGVIICGKSFVGQGKTKQEARNNAAIKALETMKHELAVRASKNASSESNGNVQSEENAGECNNK